MHVLYIYIYTRYICSFFCVVFPTEKVVRQVKLRNLNRPQGWEVFHFHVGLFTKQVWLSGKISALWQSWKERASLKTTNHMNRMCGAFDLGNLENMQSHLHLLLILRPDQCSQSQAISLADLIHEHLQDRCSMLGLKLKWWINVSRCLCKTTGEWWHFFSCPWKC